MSKQCFSSLSCLYNILEGHRRWEWETSVFPISSCAKTKERTQFLDWGLGLLALSGALFPKHLLHQQLWFGGARGLAQQASKLIQSLTPFSFSGHVIRFNQWCSLCLPHWEGSFTLPSRSHSIHCYYMSAIYLPEVSVKHFRFESAIMHVHLRPVAYVGLCVCVHSCVRVCVLACVRVSMSMHVWKRCLK